MGGQDEAGGADCARRALVEAAERVGVCLGQVAYDPLSLYFDGRRKCADVGVQMDTACPVCISLWTTWKLRGRLGNGECL